ncbi:MAG: alpha/beta fold hydrolase [Acidimicrobiales bacterium]
MPFIDVRDLSVYYELHGSGTRVLWINGTGGDLRQNPMRGNGPLEQHHEVLMYDQRGLGQTSKPDVDYTMADYADDAAALMDALGWDRAHVFGVSFGGMVAQHVALRHPKRVDRLVLACTSSGGLGGSSFDLASVADLPTEERLRIVLPVFDSRNDPDADPPVHAPQFEWLAEAMAAPALNSDDPDAEMGARRQLEARSHHDLWDRVGDIAAPTFVLGGRYDRQAPPENVENLSNAIPGARLAMFDGGHMFLLQDPTAWASIVDFLAE